MEIASMDDANSTTYAEPDGSFTLTNSATPIRVKQGGVWRGVDKTLFSDLSGSIRPAASPADVILGGAGSTTIATLNTGGSAVSYTWPTALPAPTLAGSTATYADIYPGVDLLVTVGVTGFETSFVYRTASAAQNYGTLSLPVSTTGVSPVVSTSGAISYTDTSGDVVAQTPAPKAWDSRLGGSPVGPGKGPVGSAASTVASAASSSSSSSAAGSQQLIEKLQIPAALLSDPALTYPLVVDPSVTCTNCDPEHHGYVENDGDVELDSTFDGGTVHVGTFDGGSTVTHGLYEFDQGNSHGATITSATLELGSVYAWSCTDEPVSVYKSTPFTAAVTWSTATLATTANSVTRSFADGYSSSCAAKEEDFTVTGIVGDTANDPTSYYYFQLRAYDANGTSYQSNNLAWKKFQASAVLVVHYNKPPNTPSSPGFKSAVPTRPGCVRGSTRPSIDATQASAWQAYVSDPDKNTVDAHFQWWDLATPTTVHTATSAYVSSGNYASVAFAGSTTTFVDGHNYGFTVRAYDGALYSGWASGSASTTSCEFHVADPAPSTPTSLAFVKPSMTCPPALAVRGDQPMAFSAYIADPDATYGKTVRATFTIKNGSTTLWSWTSSYGANRTVTTADVPANTVPNQTTFTWSVSAYNGQKASASTPTCSATTNDTVPAAPQFTSGGVFGAPGTPAGHIGDTDTITINSSNAVKYVWELTDPNHTPTSLPAPGACGSATNGVHTVCASSGSGWNQLTVRALQQEIQVAAQGYNTANTASPIGTGTFDVNEYDLSHGWFTDGLGYPDGPPAIPDSVGGTDLNLSAAGASWVSTEYAGEDSDPSAPVGGPTRYGTALELDNTGSASTAAGSAPLTVDMTHSFTVELWVRPTVASSSALNVAIAQDGTQNSTFYLGQYAGYWAFCMPHTQTYSNPWDGDCTYIQQLTGYVNQWTFLTAVWDAQAQQMRLYVNGTQNGSLATASHTSTGAGSGPITLGQVMNYFEYPGQWVGDLLNPIVYPGIIDDSQMQAVYQCGYATDINSVCN